eukprot:COSAG01_NODE_8619_length_2717_cov_5.153552_2_plen_364_part_00
MGRAVDQIQKLAVKHAGRGKFETLCEKIKQKYGESPWEVWEALQREAEMPAVEAPAPATEAAMMSRGTAVHVAAAKTAAQQVALEPTTGRSAPEPAVPDSAIISEIRQIYATYCPKTDRQVAKILSTFAGKEAELVEKVRKKYGTLPAATTTQPLSAPEEGEPPVPAPEPEAIPEFNEAAGFIVQPPGGDHSLDGDLGITRTWRGHHRERSDWEEDGWYKHVTLRPDGTYDWSYTTYNIDLYDYDRSEKATEAHGRWAMGLSGNITLDGVQGTRRQWDSFKEWTDGNPNYQGATRCSHAALLRALFFSFLQLCVPHAHSPGTQPTTHSTTCNVRSVAVDIALLGVSMWFYLCRERRHVDPCEA